MNRLPFLSGLVAGMLVALGIACGGGGSADPLVLAVAPQARMVLAFDEQWEPRTMETGVYGVVWSHVLAQTADGSDPQQGWSSNSITGKWGTLQSLDGTVPGLPDITGTESQFWRVQAGQLFFDARPATAPSGQSSGGFALISKQTFPRDRPITIEADMALGSADEGGFAGLALIAGEGDYREIAIRRARNGLERINRVTPLRETTLADNVERGLATYRIEYHPERGFRYLVNGKLLGTEPINHAGASFATDPNVGLYFVGTGAGTPVNGVVGPVRVWIGDPLSITTKEAGNA